VHLPGSCVHGEESPRGVQTFPGTIGVSGR